ncbi:MAG: serine protease [Acholeplasma sp.]|jgi:serine protease Do|nr:serine protease [Acholeplasma sp.]
MKKFFGWVRNTIVVLGLLYVTSIFVDIRIEGVPLNTVYETAAKETFKFVEDLIERIRKEPEVSALTVTRNEEGQYVFATTIKNVKEDELISITIDNVVYTEFEVEDKRTYIIVKFVADVTFEPGEANKQFTVNNIRYTRNDTENILNADITGTAFKSIDLAIVEARKNSVIGIYNCVEGEFTTTCSSWGSGVIFDRDTREVTVGLNTFNEYDYYIITNAHVVEGGSIYRIYYNGNELNDRATLVGTYTDDTDLAILKLTTRAQLLVLSDNQFVTKTALPVYQGQTVFSIGSPGGPQNFNTVKEGIVTALNVPISLGNDSSLCPNTCSSFQTNAALGAGSSGGAMFDSAGNLIGIHFAGNEENTVSSEIPMSKIFEAIEAILNEE